MIGSFSRIATAACLCALLGACSSDGAVNLSSTDLAYAHAPRAGSSNNLFSENFDPNRFPGDEDAAPATIDNGPHLECVPYAREHSAVNIHGDAYTWWDKAAGVYSRGHTPLEGAVMVMVGYAGKHRAHVAVVRRMVSAREIRIDHANWLNDGKIYVNDPVMDVSDANDWTQVKVWNIRSGSWGTKIYNVKGFIGPGTTDGEAVVASNNVNTVVAGWDDPIARQIASATNVTPVSDSAPAASSAEGGDELLGDDGADR